MMVTLRVHAEPFSKWTAYRLLLLIREADGLHTLDFTPGFWVVHPYQAMAVAAECTAFNVFPLRLADALVKQSDAIDKSRVTYHDHDGELLGEIVGLAIPIVEQS